MAITKVSDVPDLLTQARQNPHKAFPAILKLAISEDPYEREVAATLLVEASKKKPDEIVAEMSRWADNSNPNVRRTASEGLRDVARTQPEMVLPVIVKLKTDPHLYVKKSVANDQEAAIAALKTALFWDSKLIDAHILLGRIFLARGDLAQARKYAASALALDPNNAEAQSLQRQILR